MANDKIKEFADVLCLRNQLLVVDEKKLIDTYEDYENYEVFIDSVVAMINNEAESPFLLYRDSFVKKIENIVQIHRYNLKDEDIKEKTRDIIAHLNTISNYTPFERKIVKEAYRIYNESIRNIAFDNDKEFLYSLGYDAVVYAAITENDMELINQNDMFLSSINYFLDNIPEIFNNSDVRKRTLTKIDKLSKGFGLFDKGMKKYSKATREGIEKIKTKEE